MSQWHRSTNILYRFWQFFLFQKSAHCARVGGARIDIRYAYEAESPEDSESVKQSRLRPLLGGQNWTQSWEIVLATFPKTISIDRNREKSGVPKSAHCARLGGARIDIRYAYEAESPEDSEFVKQSRLRPLLGGQTWTQSWEIVLATFPKTISIDRKSREKWGSKTRPLHLSGWG